MATERRHPLQTGQIREDGSYLLRVPYTDDRELIMDILKYGADCPVLEHPALARKVLEQTDHNREIYFHMQRGKLTI